MDFSLPDCTKSGSLIPTPTRVSSFIFPTSQFYLNTIHNSLVEFSTRLVKYYLNTPLIQISRVRIYHHQIISLNFILLSSVTYPKFWRSPKEIRISRGRCGISHGRRGHLPLGCIISIRDAHPPHPHPHLSQEMAHLRREMWWDLQNFGYVTLLILVYIMRLDNMINNRYVKIGSVLSLKKPSTYIQCKTLSKWL